MTSPPSPSAGNLPLSASPPAAPAAPVLAVRPAIHPRAWPAALCAVVALSYLLWAGSSFDPRRCVLWTFTPLSAKNFLGGGWLVGAPGLGNLWIASSLLFAALCVLAYHAMVHRCGSGRRARIVIAGSVFLVALIVRLLVLRYWLPLSLEPATFTARTFHAAALARWPLLLPEMLTVALLILAQFRHSRSLWLPALYAFHPVPLLMLADGSRLLWLLPLIVFVAALETTLRPWLRTALAIAASLLAMASLVHQFRSPAALVHPFNGLLPTLLTNFSLDNPRYMAPLLLAAAALFQFAILVLAGTSRWPLARTWIHILVAWALVTPQLLPVHVLLILALIPLAWSAAGWILSVSCLSAYVVALSWHAGQPFQLPFWVVLLSFMPVLVVEAAELLSEAFLLMGSHGQQPQRSIAAAGASSTMRPG